MEAALFSLAAAVLVLSVALVVLAGSAVHELARLARIRLGQEVMASEAPKRTLSEPVVDAPPPRNERPRRAVLEDVPSDMDGA